MLLKNGTKIKIIGNTRIKHHFKVPSIGVVVEYDSVSYKVEGCYTDRRRGFQWIGFADVVPIPDRKAQML